MDILFWWFKRLRNNIFTIFTQKFIALLLQRTGFAPFVWLLLAIWLYVPMVTQDGERTWLLIDFWIMGVFFWIYILNRRISFMDLWNMISFVMPIIFDMYWNFVYQYHDNLVVMSVNTRKIVDLKDEIYLKLMRNFLNLSLTF